MKTNPVTPTRQLSKTSGFSNTNHCSGMAFNLLIMLILLAATAGRAQVNFYSWQSTTGNSLETIIDPVVLTTTVNGTFDNDYNLISPADFSFPYNATNFTQFTANTNGYIKLGPTPLLSPANSLNTAQNIDAIFITARDGNMNIANGGNLTHGPAAGGKYVIQFTNLTLQNTPSATQYATSQIVLWGVTSAVPGKIELIYGNSVGSPTFGFYCGLADAGNRYINGLNGLANAGTQQSSWLTAGTKSAFTPPAPCVTPVVQPTNLTSSGAGPSSINMSFTAAAGVGGYLLVRYPAGATPTTPQDGITYLINAPLGAGYVAYTGTSTSHNIGNLSSATAYDFYVYTYNTNCLGAPVYNTASPLTNTFTTNTGTISGIITVGPGGTFNTLTQAFAAIGANGMSGDVTLQLIAGYPTSPESFPLGNQLGSGATGGYQLEIYPTVPGLSIGSNNNGATISLNGVKNLTIDGRVNKTGPADLTISNVFAGAFAHAVQFTGDAAYNTVRYCKIRSANNGTGQGTVYFASGLITGNDFNTVEFCDIADSSGLPANAVYSFGTSLTVSNNNNTIANNTIRNYISASSPTGILVANNNDAWTITNNKIYQESSRTVTAATVVRGIWITSGSGHTVNGNIIGYSAANGTGTSFYISAFSHRFTGIEVSSTNSILPVTIEDNIVSNIVNIPAGNTNQSGSAATVTGIQAAMAMAGGTIQISGNTIGDAASGNITLAANNTSVSSVNGIFVSAFTPNQTIAIEDNVINSIGLALASATGSLNFTGIGLSNSTGTTISIERNTIGSDTPESVRIGTPGGSGSSGTIYGIDVTGSGTVNAGPLTIRDNSIKNITDYMPAGSMTGIRSSITGVSSIITTGNTISNYRISSATASTSGSLITGININGVYTSDEISENEISGFDIAVNSSSNPNMYGINSDHATNTIKTIRDNSIRNFWYSNSGSATGGFIFGIFARRSDSGIFNNRIAYMEAMSGVSSAVAGIISDTSPSVDMHHNIIGNFSSLTGTITSGYGSICGISLSAVTNSAKVFHNTVYLNASGSNTLHSAALYTNSTVSNLDLRNNILVNTSTPGTSGRTVAFGRGTTATAGLFASTSNHNLLYAGLPGSRNLVYWDTANADQQIAAFKSRMSPRELNTISGLPIFLSVSAGSEDYLHIDPSDATGIESGGNFISGYTNDIDGDLHNTSTPDIGADEGNFSPYAIVNPPVIVTSTGGIFSPSRGYATVADAVFAINNGQHTGTIVCSVESFYTEVVPSSGLIITATGTESESITFVKSGSGDNPVLMAPSTNLSGDNSNAIIKIVGGDYITIDGFTLLENPLNTSVPFMTDMGIGIFYASTTNGAQHCTIRNCTIDLNRLHHATGIYSTSAHSSTLMNVAAGATTPDGANSHLTITGNTITDVNMGIVVVGPAAAADFNEGLVIGGTPANGNTISNYGNFGGQSAFSGMATGASSGIQVRHTKNITISHNAISTVTTGVPSNATRAIHLPAQTAQTLGENSININDNSISVRNATFNSIEAITVDTNVANATTSLNIDRNNIYDTGFTTTVAGQVLLIRNLGIASTVSISGNTFTDLALNSTAGAALITNTLNNVSTTISDNAIVGSLTSAGSLLTLISNLAPAPATIENNNFSNISGITSTNGIAHSPATPQVFSLSNNTISNVTATGTNPNILLAGNNGGSGSSISGNTISGISTVGTITGVTVNSGAAPLTDIKNNKVFDLVTTASVVSAISVSVNNTGNVDSNKVYGIESNHATGTVTGITIMAGTHAIKNNYVGDLRAPISGQALSIMGINAGGPSQTADHNTVYLTASSTAPAFGSVALYANASSQLTMRNNILINNSVPGSNNAFAYRRSSNNLSTYNSLSGNNLLLGSAIYGDGIITDATMAAFKSRVYPRDAASFSTMPVFISTTGSSSDYLHIAAADQSGIESGGIPVASVTTDYDGDTRNTNSPDIGADEGAFTAAVLNNPQVTVTSTGGTFPTKAYMTLAEAINGIQNGFWHTGTIVCSVNAAYTETAPPGGFVITATGTAAAPITFQKSGAGLNPAFYAYTPQVLNETNNAVFKIIGGDYITIDGFTMFENATNTVAGNMTEFGVALFYATPTNGAQNCTIKNCTIDLDRTYLSTIGIYSNSSHAPANMTNSATATGPAGGNHNLRIESNLITDVNLPIVVVGPNGSDDANDGLVIGGSPATANTITNFASNSNVNAFTGVGAGNAIFVRGVRNMNASYNDISVLATLTGTLRGIYHNGFASAPTGAFTTVISNNNISLRNSTSVTIEGIATESSSSNALSDITVNNNNFYNSGYTVNGTSGVTFLRNAAASRISTINGNTFSNLAVNTSSQVNFILSSGATVSSSISNNATVGSFSNSLGGGLICLSSGSNCPASITGNNFSNMSMGGGFTGISHSINQLLNCDQNTISNVSSLFNPVAGIVISAASGESTVSKNVVSGLTAASTITAISFGGAATSNASCFENTVFNIKTTTGSTVYGINMNSFPTSAIYANKVYDLSGEHVSVACFGISLGSGISSIYNNIVGDIRTPNSTSSNGIIGINLNSGTATVDHNTVWLSGTSTGSGFGSSALYISSSATFTLRNNILVNNTTATGSSRAVAFRRNGFNLGTYNLASGANLLSAHTTYFDGTYTELTVEAFKSRMYPREAGSITGSPVFESTTGASNNFLHINPADATGIESGGIPLAGVTMDYDGDARDTAYPDIGADEGDFVSIYGPDMVTVTSTAGTSLSKTYRTLAAAINAINGGIIHSGGIVCEVEAGYSEMAPAAGFTITASGTAEDPIIFRKTGIGVNPSFIANSPQPINDNTNAIFRIVGADYVTIDGFSLLENDNNTTANIMTEYGVAVLYANATNGSQHCTIQNCTIDLNRLNGTSIGVYSNSNHTPLAFTTVVPATTVDGNNSYLTVTRNTITDVNVPIAIIGAPGNLGDTGMIIGGTAGNGNTITNFGTSSVPGLASVNTGVASGIVLRNCISYSITNNDLSSIGVATISCRGIWIQPVISPITISGSNVISGNSISIQPSAINVNAEAITIDSNTANALTDLVVSGNKMHDFYMPVASTGGLFGFRVLSVLNSLQMKNNQFEDISINTNQGSFLLGVQNPATYNSCSIAGNEFNNITHQNTGVLNLITNTAVGPGPAVISGNQFAGITGTGTGGFTGISTVPSTAHVVEILDNTMSNVSFSGTVIGISLSATAAGSKINGNVLSDLTSNSNVTGIIFNPLNPITCNGNTLHGLKTNTNGSLSGISSNAAYASIGNNKLYNLESATGTATGIVTNGAEINIVNNMIADIRTPGASGSSPLMGISVNGSTGSLVNVYHNTVYLNATSSGPTFGSAAMFASNTPVLNMQNNIFINKSVANGVGFFSAAYRRNGSNLTTYSPDSNNNLFFASTIYTDGGNTDNTLVNYKNRVAPRDFFSAVEDVLFISVSGEDADFLHIDPTVSTLAESGGKPVASVTEDIDGDLRSSTAPDIGADEGDFTGSDVFGPVINYTLLQKTSSLGNPILANVVITDNSGVNVSAGTKPRLYYKKSTDANTVAGWKFVETDDTESPFSFELNYSLLAGGAAYGQTIQYFVVAQDLGSSVSINSGNFATAAGSVALTTAQFPITGTINSYVIAPPVSGIKTICPSGCDYTSLTNSNGAFQTINNQYVNGDISLHIAGDLTETGTFRLSEFTDPYTMTIKPVGGQRTITGSNTTALIGLFTADRVTIDGSLAADESTLCPSFKASRDLTIRNTSAGTQSTVIFLFALNENGCSNNVVKNCNIIGNTNSTTLFGIGSATNLSLGSTGFNSDNNAFINNRVTRTQVGIYTAGASFFNKNTGTVISQNEIDGDKVSGDNVRQIGIYAGFEDGIQITGNSIANLDGAVSAIGIACGAAAPTNFSYFGSEVSNPVITNNRVRHLQSSTANFVSGIFIATNSNTTTSALIANNIVSEVFARGTDIGSGIFVGGGPGTTTILNNTLSISGNATAGTFPNYGMCLGNTVHSFVVRNNIIVNSAVNGNGNTSGRGSYIMALLSSNYANLTSNNNSFYTNGSEAKMFKINSFSNGASTEFNTFAAYQAALPGKDLQSVNIPVTFLSSENMIPDPGNASHQPLSNGGAEVSAVVPQDIMCVTRSATPSMGAIEFTICATAGAGTLSAGTVTGGNISIVSTGYSDGEPFEYLWESSMDPGFSSPVTEATMSSYANLSTPALSSTTYYRLKVSCLNGGAVGYSNVLQVQGNPPGNALRFSGNLQQVSTTPGPTAISGSYTVEAWVKPAVTNNIMHVISTRNNNEYGFDMQIINGNLIHCDIGNGSNWITTSADANVTYIPNQWIHLAIVVTPIGYTIYKNGTVAATGSYSSATPLFINSSRFLKIGRTSNEPTDFQGDIDEVRVYNSALSGEQILADMTSVQPVDPESVKIHYNFDQGIAGGSNNLIFSMPNLVSSEFHGTLDGYVPDVPGSNWNESYAMVAPGMLAASNITATGFTANWSAPSVGMAENYVLDVSTSSNFSSFVPGYAALAVSGTSSNISALPQGSSYYYRVRASKSSASGMGAWSNTSTMVVLPYSPPGNALQFDGLNDYVSYSNPPNIPLGNTPYTLEAWINPDQMGDRGIIGYGNFGAPGQTNALRLTNTGILNYWWGNDLNINTGDISGIWHHVAATFDGSSRKIYLDGKLIASDSPAPRNVPSASNLKIGATNNLSEMFDGKIDESRIWNVALSIEQINANMHTDIDPATPGLVLYHRFDKGISNANNPDINTVEDLSTNNSTGTLQNFQLTGTASNWTESYAMVAPVPAQATNVLPSGFTANWLAPQTGVAESYKLYVSTNQDFTSMLPGYSGLVVNGTSQAVSVTLEGTYYYRVVAEKASVTGQGAFTAPYTSVTVIQTTVWNGLAWSQGPPNVLVNAVIAGPYISAGNLEALNLTVDNDAVVTISSGDNITLGGNLIALSGSMTFDINANLLQDENAVNIGNISIKRDVNIRRLDYVFWGSPVAGQDLFAFSPLTTTAPTSRFYQLIESTGQFQSIIPDSEPTYFQNTKGYMVRAPNTWPTNGSQQMFHGVFTGVPHNGDYNAPVGYSGPGFGFNMLSNPYPSTIDAELFLHENPGTLYFWTHTTQNGQDSNYAAFNSTGPVASGGGEMPNGTIQIGQGFLYHQTSQPSGNATFDNSMRVANNDGQFYRSTATEKHRIWLNLSNPQSTINQILIGYVAGATAEVDASYDGPQNFFGSSISSIVNNQKFAIQAKGLPFTDTDSIPLSFNAVLPDTYTIAMADNDGIFADGQLVYLKDNLTGTTHNLSEGAYSFVSGAGTFDNRFEIVYQATTLGTDPVSSEQSLIVYAKNKQLHLQSSHQQITEINVYDIAGRLVYQKTGLNELKSILSDIVAEEQMLLVRVTTADGLITTKKIVF